jgi:hypothetical protein
MAFQVIDDSGGSSIGKSCWVYMTGTYDGTTKKHYQNGSWVRDDVGGVGGAITSSQAEVTIGSRFDIQNFGGLLDEVRLSNVTRSADWITYRFILYSL